MIKIDELASSFSCLNRAKDDEMLFVLLERDPAFVVIVQFWIDERIRLGLNEITDSKIISAMETIRQVVSKKGK